MRYNPQFRKRDLIHHFQNFVFDKFFHQRCYKLGSQFLFSNISNCVPDTFCLQSKYFKALIDLSQIQASENLSKISDK